LVTVSKARKLTSPGLLLDKELVSALFGSIDRRVIRRLVDIRPFVGWVGIAASPDLLPQFGFFFGVNCFMEIL
jgi:hypothetical protein